MKRRRSFLDDWVEWQRPQMTVGNVADPHQLGAIQQKLEKSTQVVLSNQSSARVLGHGANLRPLKAFKSDGAEGPN